MPKRRPESHYYEPVRAFLRSKMGCVVESYNVDGKVRKFVERGLGGLIVDVYGLRGVEETGSRAVDGIAVEVKRSRSRTSLRNLVQTSQYARLAHRCYLAQPRSFSRKTIDEASRFGVGLLEITRSGIKIRAESRRFSPDPETFYMFLHKSLRIVRCAICSCYLFRYKSTSAGVAIDGHWVRDQIAPVKPGKWFNKKVYLCKKCEEVVGDVAGHTTLRERVDRIEKRLRVLQSRLARL
jgi:hypothetical protein